MPSPLENYIGLAKQSAKGTTNSNDASFVYVPTETQTISPNTMIRPLPLEQAAIPMLRNVHKAAYSVAGTITFIPRVDSIGWFLLGALGVSSTPSGTGPYTHDFSFSGSSFTSLPWFTFRRDLAGLTGEIFTDCRISSLAFRAVATDYVRATATVVGISGSTGSTASWGAAAKTDTTAELVSVASQVTSPGFGTFKIVDATIAVVNEINPQAQYIVGSPYVADLPVRSRSATITAILLLDDPVLYKKITYDPAGGASWTTAVLKDATFSINMRDTSGTYGLQFLMINDGNIVWSADPVGSDANDQTLTIRVTGTVTAGTNVPFKFRLVTTHSTQY